MVSEQEYLATVYEPDAMEEKIDDYLKFGVRYVWLIDPRKKLAWSYTREGRREAVSILTTDEPGIVLPIVELFEELSEEIEQP